MRISLRNKHRREMIDVRVVAAGHNADLTYTVPSLANLLSKDKLLNYEVCWVLREMAKKKKNARVILEELNKIQEKSKQKILEDENVIKVVDECEKQLKPKKPVGNKNGLMT
ncbi:MAG: hypothetical protein HQK55_13915 [Deltaproteobacteria bacterium]|nr:hypothetical protein [Deltaproteobacteria bacterium]